MCLPPCQKTDSFLHKLKQHFVLLVFQAERDAFKVKGEELELELEASKEREGVLSAELEETQGRLEVWISRGVCVTLLCCSLVRNCPM